MADDQKIVASYDVKNESALTRSFENAARNADKAESAIEKLRKSGGPASTAIEKMAKSSANSLGALKSQVTATAAAYRKAVDDFGAGSKEAMQASKAMRDASSKLKQVESDLKGSASALGMVSAAADDTQKRVGMLGGAFDGMGAKVAIGGAAMLMASRQFIQAANEGMAAQSKLEAMMGKRGEGGRFEEMTEWAGKLAYAAALPDDDPLVDAAAGLMGFGMSADKIQKLMPGLIGQSRLYGQSLESVAEAVGRAFGKGEPGGLARIGVTIDPAALESIKGITDHAAKQDAMFKLLQDSFQKYALGLTEGLSEAQIQANRTALAMDDLQTNIGRGAVKADMAIKGLGASLVDLVADSPDAQATGGWLLTMGGYAATAAGGLIELKGHIGAARAATLLSSIATKLDGDAASVAAGQYNALALAKGRAAAAGGGAAGVAGKAAGFFGANAFGLAGGAALGLGVGAAAVGAYAASEVAPGIHNAQTLSDEALRAKGPMGAFHEQFGRNIGTSRIGMLMEGQGFNKTAEGDAAAQQSAAIMAAMGANNGKPSAASRAVQSLRNMDSSPAASPSAYFTPPTGIQNTRAGFDAPAVKVARKALAAGPDAKTMAAMNQVFGHIGAIFSDSQAQKMQQMTSAPQIFSDGSTNFDPAAIHRSINAPFAGRGRGAPSGGVNYPHEVEVRGRGQLEESGNIRIKFEDVVIKGLPRKSDLHDAARLARDYKAWE